VTWVPAKDLRRGDRVALDKEYTVRCTPVLWAEGDTPLGVEIAVYPRRGGLARGQVRLRAATRVLVVNR
jgi:hypothetical protein